MKKSKILFNTLCVVLGSASITIPAVSCSCHKEPQPEPVIGESIPEDEMVFDESKGTKVFVGFKQKWSAYDGYTSIVFPGDVLQIADSACESVAGNEIPASITTIEFLDNTNEEIPLIIGKSAFANASHIKTIKFPQRLKYVGEQAFAGCYSVDTIDITSWTDSSFTQNGFPFADINIFQGWQNTNKCKVLFNQSLNNHIVSLYYMFTGAGLGDTWIDVNYEEYEDPNFTGKKYHVGDKDWIVLDGIKNASAIVDGVLTIPQWADAIAPKFTHEYSYLVKYVNVDTTHDTPKLSIIYYQAFNISGLMGVDLTGATNLKTLGTKCFAETNLGQVGTTTGYVRLPTSVESIGSFAFYNSRIQNIDLSQTNIKKIQISCFQGCLSLSEVKLPSNLGEIDPYAFSGCSNFTTLSGGNNIKLIGAYAFNNCMNFSQDCISFVKGAEYIGDHAFYGCDAITSITIGKDTWSIGDGAFSCMDNLEMIKVDAHNEWYESDSNFALYSKQSVTLIATTNTTSDLKTHITAIGESALEWKAWPSDTLDLSEFRYLKTIKKSAFKNFARSHTTGEDQNITVKLPITVEYIEDNAFECSHIIDVNIQDLRNLKHIGNEAFRQNYALESVELPNNITTIPYKSFCDSTKIKTIVIPDNITEIEDRAFYNIYTTAVKDDSGSPIPLELHFESINMIPDWTGKDVFGGNPKNMPVIVHIANEPMQDLWRDFLLGQLGLKLKEEGLLQFVWN